MRITALVVLFALPLGCRSKDIGVSDSEFANLDLDGDGFIAEDDCDDNDVSIYPGAAELCDGVDNNCNGSIDEGVTDTWYVDADGDGYGDADNPVEACEAPEGAVEVAGDCDDGDADYHPGAPEDDCTNPNDYNCDGSVGYDDADGDGWPACEECDDSEAAVNPDALEVCDGVDNDCDGLSDDADDSLDLSSAQTFYADADADGYGDAAAPLQACEQPEGASVNAEDCDDAEAAVNPGAAEVCNALDDDCDGLVDDADDSLDLSTAGTSYADADGDGYGDPGAATVACEAPSGEVDNGEDCDDGDAAVNPAATEVCDTVDNDCDGDVDDDDRSLDTSTATTWYADSDGDGVGSSYSARACEVPSGYVATSGDCDDNEASAYPGATESCDEIDNDCDSSTDEGVTTTFYADADGDGYGAAAYSRDECSAPNGYVADATDCDDSDSSINPAGTEVCDQEDNDCDSSTDEGVTSSFYLDLDADGYGDNATAVEGCAAPTSAYIATGDDCDDSDAAYNPGASEGCDGNDYNCDGAVDNDADGDGFADQLCGGNDCDDGDTSIYPDSNGDCALGSSCQDILTNGLSSGDGLYSIDPDGYANGDDPEDVWCDMTSHGGGWTLIATNDPANSQLNSTTIADTSTFGTPTGLQDYKANAFTSLPFQDLMFTDGTMFAVYEAVDAGTQGFYDFQAAIPSPNCGSSGTYAWSMTAGDLSGTQLCDTSLYMHPIDEDGGVNSGCTANWATYTSNAIGPAWSAYNNNGCPHDDASTNAFANLSVRVGWDTSSPVMMYAR
ncbi:MAG: hypothetical protein H6741_02020 [Alphaproteobacteria bacterium]|nr:hypothetical protein [Alphaproteobacteria bacterium]